jgi:hypothetical protein
VRRRVDDLDEEVLDVGQLVNQRCESVTGRLGRRWVRLRRQYFREQRVVQDRVTERGSRWQPVLQAEQFPPVVLAPEPVDEIESEVVVEVPLELLPVGLDEVYEATEPPGTSATPLP